MVIRFSARSAGMEAHPDGDYPFLMAGLSEYADGSGRGLTFQCGLSEPDEQDRALGMDSYCVSNELGLTEYGGVREVSLRNRTLRVVLDPNAAAGLGLDDAVIEVELEVDDESVSQLRDGLRRILTYGPLEARPEIVEPG